MSLVDDIKGRGYWRVLVRPIPYVQRRVASLMELAKIADDAQVRMRGWDYPHTARAGATRGADWIGSEDVFGHHLDAWRLYQSGQFVHYRGMGDDWRDKSGLWPARAGWAVGAGMGWGDAVWQYVEIYEYAARLAISAAGADQIGMRVKLGNIQGRLLIDDTRGFLDETHRCDIPEYEQNAIIPRAELVGRARDLGLAAARDLFERFQWDTTETVLRGAIGR
jgi:hypothetical protein